MGTRDRATLVGLALGALLLSYPLVSIPNRPSLVLGIPLLYLYLFGLWTAAVVFAWWLSRRPEE